MDAGNSDPKNGTSQDQQPVQQSLTFHTNTAFVFWVMCDKMRVNCDLDAQYMQMVGETKLAQLSHSESLRWMAYRDEHYKQQLAAGPPGPIVKPSLADISKIKKTH